MNANKFGHRHHMKPEKNNNVATGESGAIEVTDDF